MLPRPVGPTITRPSDLAVRGFDVRCGMLIRIQYPVQYPVLQEEKPETALERALVDREETVSRLERELERERLQGKSKASTLQRRLDEALQQGQSATREQETSRMALAAAQLAHEQQLRDADKKQTALRHEISSVQVCCLPIQPRWCSHRQS